MGDHATRKKMLRQVQQFFAQYEQGNCFQPVFGKKCLPVRYMSEHPQNLEEYADCVIVVETGTNKTKRTYHSRAGNPWDSPRKFSPLKSAADIFVSYRSRSDKRFGYKRYRKEIDGRLVYLTFVKERSEEDAAILREKSERRKRKRKRNTKPEKSILPVPVYPEQDDLLPSIKRFRNLTMVAPHDFCYQPTLLCS